jgi:multicomponent Na+:H+ antiporter subunit D
MFLLSFLPIVFPVLAGAFLFLWKPKRRAREIFVMAAALITSALILAAIAETWLAGGDATACTVVHFGRDMSLSLRIDRASMVFGMIIAALWPITTLYAFEYMKHEGKETRFFAFFLMSYGVVCGIAFAEDFLTLYIFYEMLTLATLPLVMHAMDQKARYAGRKYFIYSFSGAAAVFILLIFLMRYGSTLNFTYGGVLDMARVAGQEQMLRMVFVVAFFGFGVKAAVFPVHSWLPDAAVAPTPVTALLHAVAVVKSGAFAIMRLIYFGYGTDFLYGTDAQAIAMAAAIITIVFGSARAVRAQHFKRRLAYSTISNLSYIVLAFTIMTPAGLTAGLVHMIFHAVLKITLFFCAGAVMYKTGREYVYEMSGLARKMPIVFATYTVSALGLMGIPPLGGFVGKWNIATASAALETPLGYAGAAALTVSAILTALYLMPVTVDSTWRANRLPYDEAHAPHDPNANMCLPLLLLTAGGVVLALASPALMSVLSGVAAGM